MADKQEEPTITVEVAARLLVTTEAEVRKLARLGHIPSIKRGKLPLAQTVQRYVTYVRSDIVTLDEAGQMFGVTAQWVRKLIAEGFVKRQDGGGLRRMDVATGYVRFLKDDDRRSSKVQAESRVRDAKATEIEQRTAERRRDLIPLDDARTAVSVICGMTRQHFDGLAARVTRDLELRKQIEGEVDAAFNRIADRAQEVSTALRTGRDIAEARREDDAGQMGSEE